MFHLDLSKSKEEVDLDPYSDSTDYTNTLGPILFISLRLRSPGLDFIGRRNRTGNKREL